MISKKDIEEIIKFNLKNNGKETKIYTVSVTSQFGRYVKYSVDKTSRILDFAKEKGLKTISGNDSPRGGKLGNYIIIKLDKRNRYIKRLLGELK